MNLFTPVRFFKQFEKLQANKVHIYCPICQKKRSNQRRSSVDPEETALIFQACAGCYQNGRKPEIEYYTKKLKKL